MEKPEIDIGVRHLTYLVCAAEQGSFRRAADVLGVPESSISRRIRDVEDRIGTSLFVRHSGGVNLTLAGQRFIRRAQWTLDQLNEGAREAATIGRSEMGRVRVGLFSSLGSGFLSNLFTKYDEIYPGIDVVFEEGAARRHLTSIGSLNLDIAFTIGNKNEHNYDAILLWRERVFIALWEGHSLSERKELFWEDLILERFLVRSGGTGDEVRGYLALRLGSLGCDPQILAHKVGRYSLLGLVASCKGIAPVLESETAISIPALTYRPIAGEILPFFAITSPKNDNPAARTLLSLARTLSRSENSRP